MSDMAQFLNLFDTSAEDAHLDAQNALKACVECRHFAGMRRDHRAFLFKSGRGYCDNPMHPGGIWNVIQSVTRPRACPLFEEADEHIKEMRQKALIHYGVKQ